MIWGTHLCGSIYADPNDEAERCEHHIYCSEDGMTVISGKRTVKLQKYTSYCTAENRCRSLGHSSSWTGNSPTWCPKRRAMREGAEDQ